MKAILTRLIAAAVMATAMSLPAAAQQVRIRGEIVKVEGPVLTVKSRGGETITVRLAEQASVTLVVKAALADITPTAYVGAAAMPQADGTLKALEIHIFAPDMRGVGEGSRDFDLEPGSTMTNATVTGTVAGANGTTLTLTYPSGSKTVVIPPGTPIVSMAHGTLADVKAGAGIVIFGGDRLPDGAIEAKRITVGSNGVNPPM